MRTLKIKYMKLKIYKLGVSPHEIRLNFGDLRFRKTWEAAYQHYFNSLKKKVQSPTFSVFYQPSLFDITIYQSISQFTKSKSKSKSSNIVPFQGIQLSFNF